MTTQTSEDIFLPAGFDPSDVPSLEALYRSLLDRQIATAQELETWLTHLSQLTAAVQEYGARCRIRVSCHTDDTEAEKRFLHYVEQISPAIQPLFFAIQKKYLSCPVRDELTGPRYSVLHREWLADVELFREENIPLQTQATKLAKDYDKICGAMTIEFRGTTHTIQQMGKHLEDPDGNVREQAWRLVAQRRIKDVDQINQVMDRLLSLRGKIAHNARTASFREYAWKQYKRFDYTPADCDAFADAVQRVCVPMVERLDEQRCVDFALPALRPWDLNADPHNRPALRPYDAANPQELVDKTRQVFARVSEGLENDFAALRPGDNLDLDSRPAKRAGGFHCRLEQTGESFIFMNAAGLQRDVETLLHEAGHAFHGSAAHHEPLVFLRHAPMEFCEVASMSMELVGADHFDLYYPPDDTDPVNTSSKGQLAPNAARAKRTLIEGIIRILPWIATIDQFQQWLYTHPGHSHEQRTDAWLGIRDRFSSTKVDWSGFEDHRAAMWQKQLHLFHWPFYYIEYGIAQLGALQMWSRYRKDPQHALSDYRAALALGGTRPLPELFKTAGLRFDFSADTLEPLIRDLYAELEQLPQ